MLVKRHWLLVPDCVQGSGGHQGGSCAPVHRGASREDCDQGGAGRGREGGVPGSAWGDPHCVSGSPSARGTQSPSCTRARMRARRFASRWVSAVAKLSLYCRSRWSSSGSVTFIQIVIDDCTRTPLLVLTLPLLCRKRSFMSTSLTRSDIFVHARMGVACNFLRFFPDSQNVRICVFLVRVYVCAFNTGRKDHDGGGGKGRHQGGASDGGENRHQGGMCKCRKCFARSVDCKRRRPHSYVCVVCECAHIEQDLARISCPARSCSNTHIPMDEMPSVFCTGLCAHVTYTPSRAGYCAGRKNCRSREGTIASVYICMSLLLNTPSHYLSLLCFPTPL